MVISKKKKQKRKPRSPSNFQFIADNKVIFDTSEKINNPNRQLSEFFGNSAMGRLLDVFFDNPHTWIYTVDLLRVSGLSRMVMFKQTPMLLDLDAIVEEKHGVWKFFRLNNENKVVKQISKFRDMLIVNDPNRKQQSKEEEY